MFQFEHIEYLWVLAAVIPMVVFYYYAIRKKKQTIKKIGDERLVKELIKDYSPRKYFIKFILIIIAFVFGTLALANLRRPHGSISINRKGIDVIIALDVSKSMLAQDVKPNRLERAKQFVSKLIDKLPDDKIGLVVFAGKAYLQMPLTTDHPAAKMYLSSISTDVVPTQGTVIGDALKMCYSAFNTQEKKYKSIILISDGEDHDESAIKMTKALANEGVMINTIGIGSPDGAIIPDPETGEYKKDVSGNTVITRLNEDELKNIALSGNGIYQLFQNNNTDDLSTTLEVQLKQIGQKSLTDSSSTKYQNYFPWFLIAALLALLLEFFTSEIKKVNAGKAKPAKAVLITLFILLSVTSFAQNENTLIIQGNTAYKNQKFDEATTAYKKAIEKNAAGGTAQYNLGNALYKSGKNEDAIKAYDNAIENSTSPVEKETAWYNKGLSLQDNNKLPECIDAYEQALRINPYDEDARQNLQKALQKQKQQQQQNQNKDKEKKEKQKQQGDNKNNQPTTPKASNLSKQDAEEKLKALMQQEKNLQGKLRKVNAATPDKPEKDW